MTATTTTTTFQSTSRRGGDGVGLPSRPAPPAGRRRNLAAGAAAVLLVLGGGYVSFQMSRSAGERTPVIAMARDVPAGAVITREDLRAVEVNAEGVATIPVEDADSVIGRLAAGPLPEGSLITPDQLTSDPPLTPGRGVLSIPVPQGQVPVGLRPGSRVALLVVDEKVVATSGVTRVEATVVQSSSGAGDTGLTIVSVELAETESLPIAQAAATGKVTVMLLSGGDG